jgi:hypothetical protein
LNTLYQSHPELREAITGILDTAFTRVSSESTGGSYTNYHSVSGVADSAEILQPILPALIEGLTGPDRQIRFNVMLLLVAMQPGPPAATLDSLIHLMDTETDYQNQTAAIAAVARYCTAYKSQPAIAALVGAAGPDQGTLKRDIVLGTISSDATLCADPAFVDTILVALQSDHRLGLLPASAAHAALRFDPVTTARPLMAELERVATTGQEGPSAEAARQTLEQFRLRQQR